MRRFERLLVKPVAVRELDVDDTIVTTREGLVGGELRAASQTFASAKEADAHAEALVAQWRKDGFIPITRVPTVAEEAPVHRRATREWVGADGVKQFCEIEQRDKKVREIRTRVIGGDDVRGRPEVFEAPTIKDASAYFDRLIHRIDREIADAGKQAAEAKRKAAQQLAARKAATKRVTESRLGNPALEAQCRASPDSPEPWIVYADWLQERGEPIGEAAGLALRGDEAAAQALLRESFLELHPTTEDEEVDDDDDGYVEHDAHIELRLRHGFVAKVVLKIGGDSGAKELPALIKRVLPSPACRFVDAIQLGLATTEGYANDWSEALRAICKEPIAKQLRSLELNAYDGSECEISWVPYGDLASAWPSLPALEHLHIRAGLDGNLGTLELPDLRTFIFESGGMRRNVIEAVLARPRPKLAHLELWTGTHRYGGEIALDDVQPILDGKLPALRHLGIVNSELSDVIIPALAASKLLPRLESLDLSRGIFANVATDALVQHARAFRHLASIDLSNNVLYEEEVARICEVLDNVIVDSQRSDEREDDFPDDPGDRYTAVGE